jgi:hypothetical protein
MLLEAILLAATASPIFVTAEHPRSGRTAILEELGGVAYLYLSAKGEPRPEGDVVVYSTGTLATDVQAKKAAQAGDPPPLTSSSASREAVVVGAVARDFSFVWTPDGEQVCVLRKGRPHAMIVLESGKRQGYSRAIGKAGFYGRPWNQAVFDSRFK